MFAAEVAVNVERPRFDEHSSRMVRIHLTGGWRLDPSLSGGGRAATRRAAEAVSGVLALEVDGVDVLGGRAEGPLLPALEGLLEALAALQAGAAAAAAPFREGELLLLLRLRGSQASLTLVDLGPPARLPVHRFEVELAGLTGAALEAAAELCRRLGSATGAGAMAERRLRGAARRPRLAGGEGPPGFTTPLAASLVLGVEDAALPLGLEVELDDDGHEPAPRHGPTGLPDLLLPGRVMASLGGAGAVLDGIPFLTLRDLVSGLEELARAAQRGDPGSTIRLGQVGRSTDLALRIDLGEATLALPGQPPEPLRPAELGAAVLGAVRRLKALLSARDPARADAAALRELEAAAAAAADHLAEQTGADLHVATAPAPRGRQAAAPPQAPLAPGALRRISLRTAWQEQVGEPVPPGLVQVGRAVLATGRGAVVGRVAGRTWRSAGADWAALAGGLLLVRRGDTLLALEPGSGRPRWSRPLAEGAPTGAAGRLGDSLLLAEVGALSGLDPRHGATRWRLPLPGGSGLSLAAFGSLAAVGTSAGLVYGVDADGRVAWRLRGPGPVLAPPALLGQALAVLHAAGPGAALLLLDPATGRRLREVALDVVPAGAPARFAAGLALSGRSGGAAVVTLVRPRAGRAWAVEAPLLGAPRLAAAGRALLASDQAGGLACLDASGKVAWSLEPGPAAAAGGAAPVSAHGVVVAARDGVTLLDLRGGRVLGRADGLLPTRLLATATLSIAALEPDGAVTGLTAAGHLSLLPPAGGPP